MATALRMPISASVRLFPDVALIAPPLPPMRADTLPRPHPTREPPAFHETKGPVPGMGTGPSDPQPPGNRLLVELVLHVCLGQSGAVQRVDLGLPGGLGGEALLDLPLTPP